MKESKDNLKELIDYMNESQIEVISDLITLLNNEYLSKGDIMKLAYSETDRKKIDSAIPVDYVRSIQGIHPNFNTFSHCYSYVNNPYGEMVNISEQLISTLKERFGILY